MVRRPRNKEKGLARAVESDGQLAKATERVGVLCASIAGLREAREATDANAALAQLQLRAFFDQVAQHKHELGGMVRAVRKAVNQPITDHVFARLFFFRLAALCASCEVSSSSNNNGAGRGTAHDIASDHAQRLAAMTAPQRDRLGRGVVVFTQGDHARQQSWRAKCRVQVVRGGTWIAGEVSPSAFASLCEARSWHAAAVSHNGEVLVTGGKMQDGSYQSSCERLVVSREGPGNWEMAEAAMPTARYLCSACMVGDLCVVVGGSKGQALLDTVEAFDLVHNVWHALPSLPDRARGCGVVCVGTSVVVVGGENDRAANSTATVRALDLAGFNGQGGDVPGLQWKDLPPLSHPRAFAAVTGGDGRVFACGGEGDDVTCESLEFDVHGAAASWAALPDMPEPRHLAGCCYGGGNVFVVGGFYDDILGSTVSTVFVLNLSTVTWSQLPPLSSKRGACCAVCVGRRLLVIGGHSGLEQVATCEQYDFC